MILTFQCNNTFHSNYHVIKKKKKSESVISVNVILIWYSYPQIWWIINLKKSISILIITNIENSFLFFFSFVNRGSSYSCLQLHLWSSFHLFFYFSGTIMLSLSLCLSFAPPYVFKPPFAFDILIYVPRRISNPKHLSFRNLSRKEKYTLSTFSQNPN